MPREPRHPTPNERRLPQPWRWLLWVFVLSLAAIPGIALPTANQANAAMGGGSVSATVRVSPLVLVLAAPTDVQPGDVFDVIATASNRGPFALKKARVTLFLPEGLSIRGKDVANLGAVRPGTSKDHRWRVAATAVEPGRQYVILAIALAIEDESAAEVEAQSSVIVTVVSGTVPSVGAHHGDILVDRHRRAELTASSAVARRKDGLVAPNASRLSE